MQTFIHDDWLLETETARDLYHNHAKPQPILDYHCHLSPAMVAQNHRFRSLTELWLEGDHYKWRAMRANGVDEKYLTGDASDFQKFLAWAKTVPATLRNPLYHWTHLELAFPFGITEELLSEKTARRIYEQCNARLEESGFHAQGLLEQYGVVAVCTTDDPADSLQHHLAHARNPEKKTVLLPAWRPDRATAVEDLDAYNDWLDRLEKAADVAVGSCQGLLEALDKRHAFFHQAGCRLSDHGLDTVYDDACTNEQAEAIFAKARAKRALLPDEVRRIKSALLHEFGVMDHARGWVQQFHIGALRNNNTRRFRELGPDTGFDSMDDTNYARPLARFLDRLESSEALAKTILYNLNPKDTEMVATMIGNFQDAGVPGKLQYGSAWWFLDQLEGMERQLSAVSCHGLLSRFVGMLTDSRSFLSYSRHEYFRRLLCNLLGNDVRRGLLPDDRQLLGELVKNVCFENARAYFGFDLSPATRP